MYMTHIVRIIAIIFVCAPEPEGKNLFLKIPYTSDKDFEELN